MNRFKDYIFNDLIMARIPMVQVLQRIDDHDLIYYLRLIKYVLPFEFPTC